jgi:hypothetical protein
MHILAWGCPLLLKDFPATLVASYERRTWVYESEKKQIRKNLLLYGLDQITIKNLGRGNNLSVSPSLISYQDNNLPLDSIFKQLGYDYRR